MHNQLWRGRRARAHVAPSEPVGPSNTGPASGPPLRSWLGAKASRPQGQGGTGRRTQAKGPEPRARRGRRGGTRGPMPPPAHVRPYPHGPLSQAHTHPLAGRASAALKPGCPGRGSGDLCSARRRRLLLLRPLQCERRRRRRRLPCYGRVAPPRRRGLCARAGAGASPLWGSPPPRPRRTPGRRPRSRARALGRAAAAARPGPRRGLALGPPGRRANKRERGEGEGAPWGKGARAGRRSAKPAAATPHRPAAPRPGRRLRARGTARPGPTRRCWWLCWGRGRAGAVLLSFQTTLETLT